MMGLLVECPKCRIRCSIKKNTCSCGHNVKKAAYKNYWIEYYLDGRRKRERIGLSKDAAEVRLRKVLNARSEDKHIDKDKAATTSLRELCSWYKQLPEVKAKKSFRRDKEFIFHLKRLLGAETKIKHINRGGVESYQRKRLAEESPRHKGQNIRPATVNKEVSCLKTIINRAVNHNKLQINPIAKVKKLPENNVRMKVLTQEEFESLLSNCADHIKPVVLAAYYTGMRKSELLRLTWDNVDLPKGFIRLTGDMTKTSVGRSVPLHPTVRKMLELLPRGLHTKRVFLHKGKPFESMKNSYKNAVSKTGLGDFTFHDLRHCALNNLRLAGNDYFKIMALSGHKTMSVFKRYNLVTEEELSQMKWGDESLEKGSLDTSMDTKEKRAPNLIG
jgi:integrase